MLGYNIAPYSGKLIVDEKEATRVREILQLYLKFKSIRATSKEHKRRGWNNKQLFTKKGKARGGSPFSTNGLHKLLTNPIYIGKVKIKDETFDGTHQAIVDHELFEAVQNTLQKNRQCDNPTRKKHEFALLHNILYCPFCNACYVHHTTKRGSRVYRYYSCGNQRANGIEACDAPTLQAGMIENLVIKQLSKIGFYPEMQTQIIEQIQKQARESEWIKQLPSITRLQTVFTNFNLPTTTHYHQCESVRALLRRIEFDSVNGKLKLDFNDEEIIRQALLQDE
ncbi:MAG: recombinase family protein [Opitutaceae bacterium]